MLTPRQQKIKTLIETSSVLTTAERQDWMEMLELMNDKQLFDLENILTPAKPAQLANAFGASAPLSHIANLPSGLGAVNVPHMPDKKAVEGKAKWLDDMKLVLSEKELTAGPAKPSLPAVMPKVQQTSAPIPAGIAEEARPTPQPSFRRYEPSPFATIENPKDTGVRVPENWEPRSGDDASVLSVAIYRSLGAKKIIQQLQSLVRKEGYARVLLFLEKSNLYKAYVTTGQNFLVSGYEDDGKNVMSKKEFEEVVDIFREIQVN